MPPIREILVLHHTHTDIGYTHPQPMLWELQNRFIDEAIDACEATADWPEPSRMRWTCEVTEPLLRWCRRADSRRIERFRALVRAGQIGAGALAFHCEPMSTYPQAQRMLGRLKEVRESLGLPARVAILHDVNGMPWPWADLLLDAGVEMLLTGINIIFGGYPEPRPRAFRWRTPGGRELLAFNGEHYAAFNRELGTFARDTGRMAEGLDKYMRRSIRPDYPHDFLFFTATHTYFADNNPPDPDTAALIRRWNDEGREPRIRYVLPETLLERVAADRARLALHAGDWTDYWSFGAAAGPRELRVNRRTRERLFTAEMLAVRHGAARTDSPALLRAAQEAVDLFDEHTFTAAASIASPDADRVHEQTNHKSNCAYAGRSLSSLVLRDALEHAAGNPIHGIGAEGVLFVNAAPLARREVIRLPKAWLVGPHGEAAAGDASEEGRASESLRFLWQHFSSSVARIDESLAAAAAADTNSLVVGPVDLPAYSAVRVPVAALAPAPPAPGIEIEPGRNGANLPEATPCSVGRVGQSGSLGDTPCSPEGSGEPVGRVGQSGNHPPSADTADSTGSELATFGPGRVVTPHHTLEFDPGTGRITALRDHATGVSLLDPASPWGFFEPITEEVRPAVLQADATNRGREAFTSFDWNLMHANIPGWKPDWPAVHAGPTGLVEASVRHTPEGAVFSRQFRMAGLEPILQEITLYADRPVLGLTMEALLPDRREPWSLSVAFPFDLPGWAAHFDTADLAVGCDREQLPDVARDYVMAGRWACLHNHRAALCVACPDAPMMMFGGFGFGRLRRSLPADAPSLLLGWAYNNYWHTNFLASQPGRHSFRWELRAFGKFDPAACATFAETAARPIEVHPLLRCPEAVSETMVTVDPSDALLALRPASDGSGAATAILRNTGAAPAMVRVRVPGRPILRAFLTDPLELTLDPLPSAGGEVAVVVPPRRAVSVRLEG